MAAPSLWVRRDVQLEAAKRLRDGGARDAVELLLNNDLSFGSNADGMGEGRVDAGALLQTGLSQLSQSPHAALGVEPSASTKDIRSAYKRLAVKFHPDKNPRTTVLFQAINAACAKLSDTDQRKAEEPNAGSTKAPAAAAASSGSTKSGAPFASAQPSTGAQKQPSQQKPDPAAEERRRREDDARNREASRREEEDIRRRYQEEMRKRKEEVVREGQRVYHEEQLRAQRDAQARQERRSAEIAAAAKRAMYGSDVPAADASGMKNFRGLGSRGTGTRASADGGTGSGGNGPSGGNGRPSQPQPSTRSANAPIPQPSAGGRSFTVDSSGNVKSAAEKKPAEFERRPSSRSEPPKAPSGLRCTAFTDTVVDLLWGPTDGLVELNWRNRALSTEAWRSANKLISGTKCRKKNLLAGAAYEFRVRCVEERLGGMLGLRSAWSAPVTVVLQGGGDDKDKDKDKPSSTAYSYSGSDKIAKEVFIRPSGMSRDSSVPTTAGSAASSSKPPAEADVPPSRPTMPGNLRPSGIHVTPPRRNSAIEVDEEEGIPEAPASARSRHAWIHRDGSAESPPASEVDSASESEVDDDEEEEAFTTRYTTAFTLQPPRGAKDYEHAVRREPIASSKICGYLDAGSAVQVEADCGDWLKVKCHRPAVGRLSFDTKSKKKSAGSKEVWGWCLRSAEGHTFLVKAHETIHEGDEDEDDDPDRININDFGVAESYEGVWYEMEDDEGRKYFYNDYTGESSWSPPEWVEETDVDSGAAYYMHLDKDDASALHSTWTRPESFAKLVRLAGAKARR